MYRSYSVNGFLREIVILLCVFGLVLSAGSMLKPVKNMHMGFGILPKGATEYIYLRSGTYRVLINTDYNATWELYINLTFTKTPHGIVLKHIVSKGWKKFEVYVPRRGILAISMWSLDEKNHDCEMSIINLDFFQSDLAYDGVLLLISGCVFRYIVRIIEFRNSK